MTIALSRRRLQHLHALVAVTAVSMAEAQAQLADHLSERATTCLTGEERAADRRIALRELAREFRRRGQPREAAEVLHELGAYSKAQQRADEALFDAWAERNGQDAAEIRASRAMRMRSRLKLVETLDLVLSWLPRDEAARIRADLWDGGARSKLSARVKAAAERWAAQTEDGQGEHREGDVLREQVQQIDGLTADEQRLLGAFKEAHPDNPPRWRPEGPCDSQEPGTAA